MATRQTRSILGISVQYMWKEEIVVRTLAMDHIASKHKGSEIKNRLLGVLQKYGITIEQIFAVTTDNGSNMIKTIELINKQQGGMTSTDTDTANHRIENVLELLTESFASNELQDELSDDDDEATESQKDTEMQLREMRRTIEEIFTVRALRVPSALRMIDAEKFQRPIKNVPTRWNTEQMMVGFQRNFFSQNNFQSNHFSWNDC